MVQLQNQAHYTMPDGRVSFPELSSPGIPEEVSSLQEYDRCDIQTETGSLYQLFLQNDYRSELYGHQNQYKSEVYHCQSLYRKL